jgi:phage shock protein A
MSVFGGPAPASTSAHSIQQIEELFKKVNGELVTLEGNINKLKAQHTTTSQTANANADAVAKLTAEIATLKATHSAEVDEIYAKIEDIDKKVLASDKLLEEKEKEIDGAATPVAGANSTSKKKQSGP